MSVLVTCLGYPRIGASRELKKALESFWSGRLTTKELHRTAAELRRRHWSVMKEAGIDLIPIGDFSLYDHVLDTAVAVGAVPSRYREIADPLVRYFAMARGRQDRQAGIDVPALEMTKWFDTNYHYIVPELEQAQRFSLDASKLLAELDEARALGIEPRPVVLGPVTFLLLSKMMGNTGEQTTLHLLDRLLPVYEQLLRQLAERRVAWVQLDEPCLVLDLDHPAKEAYRLALAKLTGNNDRPKLMLTTYFGALEDNLSIAVASGCEALHIDLVRAPEQLDQVLASLPPSMDLSVGVIDSRNVWRADLDAAHAIVRRAVMALGANRVLAAPSCSLLHVPVDVRQETKLDRQVRGWLAFAEQKLVELRALADAAQSDRPEGPWFDESRAARSSRAMSPLVCNPTVRNRIKGVTDSMIRRHSPYPVRAAKQKACFNLPPFPTTTIGSFPQTEAVRAARAAWRAGRMAPAEYEVFLKEEIRRCVQRQEAIGLDVLVHGEFERTDMVEYFGEQLKGFIITEQGWVQSYGSRCVKPPVIVGDVSRPRPMTVEWATYAQSLTSRPVKGMLTGPVTMLQWSFVRDDQPREETCRQIALALRDEVLDLERAGIAMIQVDEPALREGLPLRRREWEAYLRWAVEAFRLATGGVRDDTQIHTHMCYSEFGDILGAVAELDADVISIETSRSRMELLGDFARFQYPNEIGPGVYDIHSPRVPDHKEMADLLLRAGRVVSPERLWVNPDCGLKTRGWSEVEAALTNMVEAARDVRRQVAEARS
ncbi:5-methyltetrahydropteroyltriglutamate--homocysteine S-methyltransferase [Candidatus Nitrospira inopinata]|jgi:5-methyltetrahydropteroyltriglutamate--homocysteine methyltransferase|uniref:5-methyltetrahydropteroyltriglutamate--homocysteine methyltransferase n=1 Tax=Candidatus Nitrospira inopinata TaxID=1715989 RepID=A0A0S4KPR4_9BACT|nr:5-methyltetrahydropteroyltriglutamate--homocysteine S-methyltransferase [Candidatus Nitrospira inopinata]CUQ65321.1 5-methyltetrahydropteroyltriglutamate-homocysteine S-methyltransferase [Candidatus Nitrospira inopinata]